MTLADHSTAASALPTIQRLAMVLDIVAAGASGYLSRFLTSLHETRRRQAAIERAKYRHLIYDPETGMSFGMNSTIRKITPAE
jgi:hypothetical protein